AVGPEGDAGGASGSAGLDVDDVDDADEGGSAVLDGRGTADDLDAIHTGHVHGAEIGIEGAAHGHAIHQQEEGVELSESLELRHGCRGTIVAGRAHVYAGHHHEGAMQVSGVESRKLIAGDDVHALGHG